MSEDKGYRLNRCDAAAVCSRKKGMKTVAATAIVLIDISSSLHSQDNAMVSGPSQKFVV
jgi:hypothetical protein